MTRTPPPLTERLKSKVTRMTSARQADKPARDLLAEALAEIEALSQPVRDPHALVTDARGRVETPDWMSRVIDELEYQHREAERFRLRLNQVLSQLDGAEHIARRKIALHREIEAALDLLSDEGQPDGGEQAFTAALARIAALRQDAARWAALLRVAQLHEVRGEVWTTVSTNHASRGSPRAAQQLTHFADWLVSASRALFEPDATISTDKEPHK
jgi:hypothetical protein